MAASTHHLIGSHANGRITFQPVGEHLALADNDSAAALASLAMVLQRYDVCLIPVDVERLGWLRRSLVAAKDKLSTPVICLSTDLKAGALNDLYDIDMAEFVRAPLCLDELRIRIERVMSRRPRLSKPDTAPEQSGLPERCVRASYPKAFSEPPVSPGYRARSHVSRTPHISEYLADFCGASIDAYASAAVTVEQAGMGGYKRAKSLLVNRFANAYIRQGLLSCHGNVTQAASRAGKNRRAYSALMKLHGIDACPYRADTPDDDADG
jgi:hypothetical protein